MNDNGNIRLLTPENDIRRESLSLIAGRPFRKGGENTWCQQTVDWTGNAITLTRNWPLN